jgi:hypothetical protein
VNQEVTQFLLTAVLSTVLGLYVYRLAKRGRLSFGYAIGWMGVCTVGVFAGLLIPVLEPLSRNFKTTPAAIIAVGIFLVLLTICIQLSIAISTVQENLRKLAEEIAHLNFSLKHNLTNNADDQEHVEKI